MILNLLLQTPEQDFNKFVQIFKYMLLIHLYKRYVTNAVIPNRLKTVAFYFALK